MLIKRTADNRLYDIICVNLLEAGSTIIGLPVVTSDGDVFTFPSAPIVNTTPITYPNIPSANGTPLVAPIGSVIQVRISGGAIPIGMRSMDVIVRALFNTTNVPDAIESTFVIRLQDIIG